ncbi:MAG: LacI family DNA-binding transcriptional regulator [Hyphomicrobiaceae bacterium]
MAQQKRRLRQAGILDVAARAAVSPATVSRYFNHPDLVRYKTKERILKAATELGYVRNRAAGSLNRGRSSSIGLIVPTVDNAIFAELIQEFASSLATFEHALLISAHGYDLAREAELVLTLLEHQVDGIVLVGAEHAAETFKLIEANDLPALTVWNWNRRPHLPCIGIDNGELGRLAARHLFELGHRDIACLFPGGGGNDRAAHRRDGALKALAKLTAPVDAHRRIDCPYDIDVAKEIITSLLTQGPAPTAILAGNDIIAQAAIYAAAATDRRVPDDLSVMGIGDFRGSAAIEPALTTIRIPAREIAARAATTVVRLVGDPEDAQAQSQRVVPELLIRSSTAPPRAR